MIDNSENRMALFNELMISGYLYVSISLTGFNPNFFYNTTGTVLMGIVILTAAANFLKFFTSIIKVTALFCWRKCTITKRARKEPYQTPAKQRGETAIAE